MEHSEPQNYIRGFIPYALAAFLVGLVGGFSTVLGPNFVRDIGIEYTNTTWTALAQAMSTAACAPILGRLGDAIGRRTTLLLGIGVYTLGNVLSALSGSLAAMMCARFVVGVGSAAITPVVLAYIITAFPAGAMAKGFSAYMLISSASVVFGPALGGMITGTWGWRAMVWLCAAISGAVLLACLFLGRGERAERHSLRGFDAAGAAGVLVFFSLVLCLPTFGQNLGWGSPAFLAAAGAAVIALLFLIRAERKSPRPILPGSFLLRRAFIFSVLALFLTQGLMQANMTDIIVFVNYTQPGNTVISGYAISIMYLGMSLGAVIIGPLADKREPRTVLTGSLLLTGAGCALMGLFSADTSLALLAASLGVLGFGLGGNGTIFLKVVLSGIPAERSSTGTGTYGLFRDLSAPFGVAVFVPMFTNRITHLTSLGADPGEAAVSAIGTLAAAELLCVAAGIAAVRFLPKIH